ncbi:MAG: DUF418 domain-containing protein [Acidobacteriota bacterium]
MSDPSASSSPRPPRLHGLDLARLAAFVGMVIVNFTIVMGAENDDGLLRWLMEPLQGKAAATFVVLAGVGLGLAAARGEHARTVVVTLRRAAFLFALGMLNSLIFPADILHYYAFYFVAGVLVLRASTAWLVGLIGFLPLLFVGLLMLFDYDAGWRWADYTYLDFWTPRGFVRNLVFNGWHPLIPWLAFLLFGLVLARLPLAERAVQRRLILVGGVTLVVVEPMAALLTRAAATVDAELALITTTAPIPPMPLYVIAGLAAAALAIGTCLRLAEPLARAGVLGWLTPAGRQALTLYVAHIVVGMGTLEALGWLGGRTRADVLVASLVFCGLAVVGARLWSRRFARGPLETVMRRWAG